MPPHSRQHRPSPMHQQQHVQPQQQLGHHQHSLPRHVGRSPTPQQHQLHHEHHQRSLGRRQIKQQQQQLMQQQRFQQQQQPNIQQQQQQRSVHFEPGVVSKSSRSSSSNSSCIPASDDAAAINCRPTPIQLTEKKKLCPPNATRKFHSPKRNASQINVLHFYGHVSHAHT